MDDDNDPSVLLSGDGMRDLVNRALAPRQVSFHEVPTVHGYVSMPVAFLPPGHKLQLLPELQARPFRVREEVRVAEMKDFKAYLQRYAKPENSVVFVNSAGARARAVLDYHQSNGLPGWREWVCCWDMPISEEWAAWKSTADKWYSQRAMADFLEDRADDINAPDHAVVLEAVRKFRASSSKQFEQALDEHTGDLKLLIQSETRAAAGVLEFPRELRLAIPVLRGGDTWDVPVALRFRIEESLQLGFRIPKAGVIWRKVVDEACDDLETLDLPVFRVAGG